MQGSQHYVTRNIPDGRTILEIQGPGLLGRYTTNGCRTQPQNSETTKQRITTLSTKLIVCKALRLKLLHSGASSSNPLCANLRALRLKTRDPIESRTREPRKTLKSPELSLALPPLPPAPWQEASKRLEAELKELKERFSQRIPRSCKSTNLTDYNII